MINKFEKQYAFLDNSYPSQIEYENILYPDVESALQASKTYDTNLRAQIARAGREGCSKLCGSLIKPYRDWNDKEILLNLLRQKFYKFNFAAKLLATSNEQLVYGNYHCENHYGSCLCEKCNNTGTNLVGKLLMQIREELK